MQNKKIKGSIVILVLASVLVGGTFAWLGSTDNVINIFNTESSKQSQVEIYEHFNSTEAMAMRTGEKQAINKEVQVKNNSDYNSLIRVQLVPQVTDSFGDVLDDLLQFVKYSYSDNVSLDGTNTSVRTWVYNDDGYYYYIGNIAPGYYTDKILEKVWLDPSIASNQVYKNLSDKKIKFEVRIVAEAVPSTEEAITTNKDTSNNIIGFGLGNTNIVNALKDVIKVDSKDTASGGNSDKFDNDMKVTKVITSTK